MIHTFRILLAAPDVEARAALRRWLAAERDFEVVAEAATPEEAVAGISRLRPDAVFLAVRMPPTDAFEVLERVGSDRLPATVFLCASGDPAAAELARLDLDRIPEPLEEGAFRDALKRLRRSLHAGRDVERAERLLTLLAAPPGRAEPGYLRRLVVREGERARFLDTKEILWIEAAGNYVRVHAEGGEHLLRTALAELDAKLDPHRFARIHRSVIVSLARVEEVRRTAAGDHAVVLEGGQALKLSRGYRDRLPREVLGG